MQRTLFSSLAAALCLALRAANAGAEPLVVSVYESHADALAQWRHAAPPEGLALVRFSGHPDWTPPRSIPSSANPSTAVDRSNAAMAGAWLGVTRRVVWLHPSWTDQLPDGERHFRLGATGERLRVDDEADYFVLDDAWAPASALVGAVEVNARVVPLADASAFPAAGDWVLALDLSGFATRNPGADRLRAAGLSEATLELLRVTLAPRALRLPAAPAERARALAELKQNVAGIARGGRGALRGVLALWRAGVGAGDLVAISWSLATELAEPPADLGSAGAMLVGLPEHRAGAAEIAETATQLAAWLRRAPRPPRAISLARSLSDGYLPRDAWPTAEAQALAALRGAWPELELRYAPGLAAAPPVDVALLAP